jgi:membrane protein DedA with SNARE-associated domain
MITTLLTLVTELIVKIISSLGYFGIGVLMAIQTVAIPMPSEVIIPFAGFLAGTGRFNLFVIAIVGALGSCVGSSIAYWIGRRGGRPLVEKYGRMILFSKHDLELTEKFFARFGTWAGFLGMLLPVVRSFVSFPAGIAKVPLKKYLAFVFFGSFIWCLVLGYIGEKLGENWAILRERFKSLDYIIVALIVIGAVWWVYRHLNNRKLE